MKKKIKQNINEEEFFKGLLNETPDNAKRALRISMDIAAQINTILKKRNITQRELAELLGKKESEISKWLSGAHNFTTKTIANIEAALCEEIITVPIHAKEVVKFVPFNSTITFSKSFSNKITSNWNFEAKFVEVKNEELFKLLLDCDNNCYETEYV